MNTEALSKETLKYNRRALIHRIYASVLYHLVKTDTSVEQLAVRLNWKKETVMATLDHPERWKLNTISDLLLAMNAEALFHLVQFEPSLRAQPPAEPAQSVADNAPF